MRRSLLAAALLVFASPAWSQGNKPIEIIVPFAPGASADGIARVIGNDLGARLKRAVVIESKPGAGGTLGLQLLAKAAPDGDTLAVGATGALLITPNLPGAAGFDPLRELTPLAKSTHLLKGRIWVDAKDHSLVRIEGKPGASPSFFTGRPMIVREYAKTDGFSLARQSRASTDGFLLGKTDLTIDYSDYKVTLAVK